MKESIKKKKGLLNRRIKARINGIHYHLMCSLLCDKPLFFLSQKVLKGVMFKVIV